MSGTSRNSREPREKVKRGRKPIPDGRPREGLTSLNVMISRQAMALIHAGCKLNNEPVGQVVDRMVFKGAPAILGSLVDSLAS